VRLPSVKPFKLLRSLFDRPMKNKPHRGTSHDPQ